MQKFQKNGHRVPGGLKNSCFSNEEILSKKQKLHVAPKSYQCFQNNLATLL